MSNQPHPPVYPQRNHYALTPTPLQPLNRLKATLGLRARIWVKRDDLTGCHLSGNKIRKLEFLVAEAQAQGADTLITCGGVQSNHARATALLAAQEGMGCHLILRGDEPDQADGNLLLDHLAGAQVSFYPSHSFEANLTGYFEHWSNHYRQQGNKAYGIPTGGSNGTGLWGYIACAEELGAQLRAQGIQPSRIVCATGSGGTQAGLTLGAALCGLNAPVTGIAVCDDEAWFNRKVHEDWSSWQAQYAELALKNCSAANLQLDQLNVHTLGQYVGPGYARADQDVFETIKLLARTEGLLLDPVYTGKAFYGMLQELQRGAWQDVDDILFVHTGGLFGVFPQRQEFVF
ncbi:D-cysteine desulfhydrase family protein [Simiduia aestuariiviva]|uniref:D-cysteine desulfhydrase n=1 Tax=Simiduia aestuariiviva TaxID=1510459 RepID=A0A839UNV3_9GAMM|nr:D-cysteine desulfhydrase family protein [Simiduia aestuariiviva]MBB3168219.1 D-cysteine desulfhydrase [Simiduia aestuariiviva]